MKLALEGVEKERDYYFSKLREVELLCQEQGEENAPFVDRLMEVLYASEEQVIYRFWHLCIQNRICENFFFFHISFDVVTCLPESKQGSLTLSCLVSHFRKALKNWLREMDRMLTKKPMTRHQMIRRRNRMNTDCRHPSPHPSI